MINVCSKVVGTDFEIPKRSQIGGSLLDLNFQTKYEHNEENLLKNADVFGLAFLGDGATIKRMPLMNILAMCGDVPPITISVQECTDHMQDDGKKVASYFATLFEAKVREYDRSNILTGAFFFDGASNVQKAGEILVAKFPHYFCFHGGEHVISLFFSSISKIKPIRLLMLKTCRLYNIFGSGANHGIYSQFMLQSAHFNDGGELGLLRGAGTRFATWFYAMHRLLCLKQALLATIHLQQFIQLDAAKKPRVKAAMQDINDIKFWKAMYILLRSVFPVLSTLRYCDAGTPVMNKIYSHLA